MLSVTKQNLLRFGLNVRSIGGTTPAPSVTACKRARALVHSFPILATLKAIILLLETDNFRFCFFIKIIHAELMSQCEYFPSTELSVCVTQTADSTTKPVPLSSFLFNETSDYYFKLKIRASENENEESRQKKALRWEDVRLRDVIYDFSFQNHFSVAAKNVDAKWKRKWGERKFYVFFIFSLSQRRCRYHSMSPLVFLSHFCVCRFEWWKFLFGLAQQFASTT